MELKVKPETQPDTITLLVVGGRQEQWQTYQSAFKESTPNWDVTVIACPSWEEALVTLQTRDMVIHIVLVEAQLPDMSGLDFCRILQEREVTLPRLLLLPEGMAYLEKLEVDALESGVNDCIIKDQKEGYLRRIPLVVRRVILNFHNCIVRKHAEKAVREMEERFLKVFMSSPNAIAISTLEDGRIIEVNEAAVTEFGYSRQEMIGKTSPQIGIIKNEDRETIKKNLMEKGAFYNLEMKLYTRSGAERHYLLSAQTLRLGEQDCIIQVATDITHRNRTQEELLRSKNLESIGILAGGIARDFNNFLTSIMGNISIAKMSLHDTAKIHRSLQRAEESSIMAAELANKLLTFSEGGEPLHQQNSLPDIINLIFQSQFKDSPVTFHYFKDNTIWPVGGDEHQLQQLITNILLNAVQAMPPEDSDTGGGEVTIAVENVSLPQENNFSLSEGDYVKISIKDNGSGIPPENLDKIFDPFFSTKDTVTQRGVGLGLSICQSIIKKHKGAISVESTEGESTTVTMLIPVFREESSPALSD
jgi:two-component system, cell cycle sensor histidine kinase and response regulator CckA